MNELWLNCVGFPSLRLEGKVTIGRSKSATFTLPHESVSREHALLGYLGRSWMIHNRSDLGTMLNGEPVTRPQPLSPGDVLGIGPYQLRVSQQPEELEDDISERTVPLKLALVSDQEAKKKLNEVEAERRMLEAQIEATRSALKSEVWRGMAMNRELADSRKQLEDLEGRLAKLPPRPAGTPTEEAAPAAPPPAPSGAAPPAARRPGPPRRPTARRRRPAGRPGPGGRPMRRRRRPPARPQRRPRRP